MNGLVKAARLASAAWECDRHRAALDAALAEWHAGPTHSGAQLEADPGLRRLTDQILYRFTKLQDTMGERLIPATLGWLQEPHEAWPMRDRLDRLEKLGYLDVDPWLQWATSETAWRTSIPTPPIFATQRCWRPSEPQVRCCRPGHTGRPGCRRCRSQAPDSIAASRHGGRAFKAAAPPPAACVCSPESAG